MLCLYAKTFKIPKSPVLVIAGMCFFIVAARFKVRIILLAITEAPTDLPLNSLQILS